MFTSFVLDCRPPTGLAIGRSGQIRIYSLQWRAPEGSQVDQYKIKYEAWGKGQPSSLLAGSAATRYTLDLRSIEPGGRYSVSVQAICGGHAGEWSQSVSLVDGRRSELALEVSIRVSCLSVGSSGSSLFIPKYGHYKQTVFNAVRPKWIA